MKLVAELEPGAITETKLACIERDQQVNVAELGLRLNEAKQLRQHCRARWCGHRDAPKELATVIVHLGARSGPVAR